MAFGPNSTNPRERRAYADSKLAQLKQGETTYQEASEAALAAFHSRKGSQSRYIERLGATGVVLSGLATVTFSPDFILHDFRGFVMPRDDADKYAAIEREIKEYGDTIPLDNMDAATTDPKLVAMLDAASQQHYQGYEEVRFIQVFNGDTQNILDNLQPSRNDIFVPLEVEGIMSPSDPTVQAKLLN